MFKRLMSSALVFGMAAIAPPAEARACAPRENLIETLKSSYSEELSAGGLQNSQPVKTVLEVWSSSETGTFTVIVTHPTGISCIVASGQNYFEVAPAEPVLGVPS